MTSAQIAKACGPALGGSDVIRAKVEEVVDRVVSREKALRAGSGSGQRWLGEFEPVDRWTFCLAAATWVANPMPA